MNLIREIRTAINEGMNEYKALSFLAHDILSALSIKNLSFLLEELAYPENPHTALSEPVAIGEATSLVVNGELGGTDVAAMVSASPKMLISMEYRSSRRETKAQYQSSKVDGHRWNSSIHLYYNRQMLDQLKQKNDIQTLTQDSLFTFLRSQFESFLVHELKHAVDDFRLGDLYRKGGDVTKFNDKYRERKPSPPDFSDDDPSEWLNYYKSYLNLPHEVWARFSQVVHAIRFKEEDPDVNYVMMDDGTAGKTYVMTPMASVLSSLKQMEGWEVMNEKQRRRLINVLSGIWHEEDQWVKQNNAAVASKA